ncbi:primary replicative DNA helicase [Nocardiopsis sp. Huas11]|uniref:replicative DNA helicase n=1 Tax=Nocardiopsis sp. Huas11 TaxID=2183912 RepID=UPI000EB39A85|nr:replicative DNA helicase [Nocardiopsis sp. Huas11]RKS10039.1 primary replicative DNA helicase [Nocardiopsis sp. Huas11]
MTTTDTEHADRIPPHDIGAEQIVIGAPMVDADALPAVLDVLSSPLDLYRPAHQIILQTLMEMHDNGQPLDPRAVLAQLRTQGDLTRVGGSPYLVTLTEAVPAAANAGYFAKIVADLATKRRLVEVGTRIAQLGYDGTGDVDDLVDHAVSTVDQAARQRPSTNTDAELVGDDADYFDRLAQPVDSNTVPFPWKDLEALTGGMRPGQLITVAGRTGSGKSVVGLDIARHAAFRHDTPVAYFSMEMGPDLLRNRILSAEGTIPLHVINNHLMAEQDWASAAKVRHRWANAPLKLFTPGQCTLSTIQQGLRSMARRGMTPRLVVVDHVQLMSSVGTPQNRYIEVSQNSRGLKMIAMEFDVTMVMLAQVNRGAADRADGIPRISDLRDSGSLEEDSDMVLIVHREDQEVTEKEKSPRSGEADLWIAKHRSGPTTCITVASQLHFSRFYDMAPE